MKMTNLTPENAMDWYALYGADKEEVLPMAQPFQEELIVPDGTPLMVACRHACEMAAELDKDVYFDFNSQRLVAHPGLDPVSLHAFYHAQKGKSNEVV